MNNVTKCKSCITNRLALIYTFVIIKHSKLNNQYITNNIDSKKMAKSTKIQNGVIESDSSFSQKQSSEYARSLFEASLDPLVTINTEGKITDMNEALWMYFQLLSKHFSLDLQLV